MYYAQLNDDGIVIGVQESTGVLSANNLITLTQFDTTLIGKRYINNGFEAVQPVPNRVIPTVEFLQRFTVSERVSIRSSTNPYILEWLRLADDPRLQAVNLDADNLLSVMDLLVTNNLLTQARANTILGV